ncbi:hypothetical protein EG327_008987 [Venturia inaequalis]|uniref:Uncharacterized protein n=1 Tax=Venturia inaequalis TaxID=5025 RepID=A0A8H3UR89_VENIN|nr:hypothetical protein EG327_008987 [Venturia inaequalis]
MARTAINYNQPLEKFSERIQVKDVYETVLPSKQKERESEKGWNYGALAHRVEHVEDTNKGLHTCRTDSAIDISSVGADLQEVQELANDRLQRIGELEAKFAAYAADVAAMERLKRDNEDLRKKLEESNKELDMSRRQYGEPEPSNVVSGEQHSSSAPVPSSSTAQEGTPLIRTDTATVVRQQPRLRLQVPGNRPSHAGTYSTEVSPASTLPSPPPPTPITPITPVLAPPPPPPPSPATFRPLEQASATDFPDQIPPKTVRFAPQVEVAEIESVGHIDGQEVVDDQDMDTSAGFVFEQEQLNSQQTVDSVPVDILPTRGIPYPLRPAACAP